jgi:hypothetical protein
VTFPTDGDIEDEVRYNLPLIAVYPITIKEYGINAVLMASLFLFGLYLSWKLSTFAGMLYVLLWLASYPLIHATTCRNCVYHGKQCPVPLEGGCSHLTFERGFQFLILGLDAFHIFGRKRWRHVNSKIS